MNRALWNYTWREVRWQLLGSMLLLFAFHWLIVWLTSQIRLTEMRAILALVPAKWMEILPVPLAQVATSAGRIAMTYDHPVVLVIISFWSIARGSDVVSGQIERGTMEWLLAAPVPRWRLLAAPAMLTVLGAAALALSAWLGTWAGLATVTLEDPVTATAFWPAALNLFALALLLAGLSTLLSAGDRYRWRTIGIAVALLIVEIIVKMVGIMAPRLAWLLQLSFVTAYEPQRLVAAALSPPFDDTGPAFWPLLIQTNALLIGLGLACYAVAFVIFCRRDLPAPQ